MINNMKNICLFLLIFYPGLYSPLAAQSRKTIRDLKIRSVEMHQTDFKNGLVESEKSSFSTYDKKGNPLLEIEYNPDSSYRRMEEFVYDRKGNPVQISRYNEHGKLTAITRIEYDNFGNKSAEVVSDSTQHVLEKTTFHYTSFGLKSLEITTDALARQKRKTEYRYDAHGALIERSIYNESGELISVRRYTYQY